METELRTRLQVISLVLVIGLGGALLYRVLAQGGVTPDQVQTVFLTGGSSRLPALQHLLARLLPGARADRGDDLGSVGTGLALEAWRRFG